MIKNPFPHDDGAPASWQDVQDEKIAERDAMQSEQQLRQMFNAFMSMNK